MGGKGVTGLWSFRLGTSRSVVSFACRMTTGVEAGENGRYILQLGGNLSGVPDTVLFVTQPALRPADLADDSVGCQVPLV